MHYEYDRVALKMAIDVVSDLLQEAVTREREVLLSFEKYRLDIMYLERMEVIALCRATGGKPKNMSYGRYKEEYSTSELQEALLAWKKEALGIDALHERVEHLRQAKQHLVKV